MSKTRSKAPNNLLEYRLLTGPDDHKFCERVSEALALGYQLHGSPAATFNGQNVIVAQAVIWPSTTKRVEKNGNKKRASKSSN